MHYRFVAGPTGRPKKMHRDRSDPDLSNEALEEAPSSLRTKGTLVRHTILGGDDVVAHTYVLAHPVLQQQTFKNKDVFTRQQNKR